jgi:hypothetical protein
VIGYSIAHLGDTDRGRRSLGEAVDRAERTGRPDLMEST